MRLILLGPPGTGKGTQAKILAEKLKIAHISTGDILRRNVSTGTALGTEAQAYMNKGALVPDELVTQMVLDRITQPDVAGGFILDGYPRNLNQAEALDGMLTAKKIGIDHAVYLETPESMIIQRLTGRLVCKGCGMNYHSTNMPPKKHMICDSCGQALYQRTDDKEETVKQRLLVYNKESAPLIDYYKGKQKLIRVPAQGAPAVILENILQRLGA